MRLSVALLAVIGVLVLPAAASARSAPDERVSAQAFADAAKRFQAALEGTGSDDAAWMAPCERAIARVPRAHLHGAAMLVLSHGLQVGLLEAREPLRAFRSELALVPTADPVLLSGRAAVRRFGRAVDAIPPPGRFCAEFRAWRRAGCPRSTTRAAERALDTSLGAVTPGTVRKLEETAVRLRELGVSRQDAEAFGGGDGR